MMTTYLFLLPTLLFGTGGELPQSAPALGASSARAEERPSSPPATPPLSVEDYPLTGKAAEGVSLFHKGEYGKAANALASYLRANPLDPYFYPLSYLRARALVIQKSPTEARPLLEDLLTRGGPLDGEVAYLLAEIYEQEGDLDKARATYAKVPRGSRRYDAARLAQGRLAPDLKSAHQILDKERFYWTDDRANALAILLSFAQKEKNTEEIRQISMTLFREYPATEPGDAVVNSIFDLTPTEEELRERLLVALEKRKLKTAQDYAKFLEGKLGGSSSLVLEAKGELAFYSRDWKKAIEYFEKAEKAAKDPSRAIRRRANALARQKDYETALALYEKIYSGSSPEVPFALLDAVRILRDQEDKLKEAKKLADRVVDEFPESKVFKEALWVAGWLAWRTGDDKATIDRLERLIALTETFDAAEREEDDLDARKYGFYTKERALYWIARAYARAKKPEEAKKRYEQIVREYPLSYYSHQAFDRLRDLDAKETLLALRVREKDESPIALLAKNSDGEIVPVSALLTAEAPSKKDGPPKSWTIPAVDRSSITVADHPSVRAAVMMVGLGLKEAAIDELKAQANQLTLSPDGGALLGVLTLETQDVSTSTWILLWKWGFSSYPGAPQGENIERSEAEQARSRLIDLGWKLAYPRAYGELVDYYSQEFGVPSELVFAVMRAESTFRPKVVSPARAVGLTQVLPSTANWIAKELLGIAKPSRSQLFDESVNLKLGSRFLKELVGLFDGNYALAIASYNAGPGAGIRWYKQWRDLATDEIIEEIPYTETHGYTKKVLGSMGAYRYLWGDWEKEETRSLDLPRLLPAKLGKLNGKQM